MRTTHGVRVLLVEDHPLVRKALQRQLADFGFDVVATADDGPSAVELYFEHRPDVMLSDVNLPGFSGIEATRLVLDADPDARVLLISAVADDALVNTGIEAGAVGYVLKTIDAVELHDNLMAAHNGRRGIFDRTTSTFARG
jgi:two-component system response regulator DegU